MADTSRVVGPLLHNPGTPSTFTSTSTGVLPVVLTDSVGEYIEIQCGSAQAKCYLAPLREYNGLQLGSVKCIVYNGEQCTPTAFEQKAGKRSSKNWKKSITHNGGTLATVLPGLGIGKHVPSTRDTIASTPAAGTPADVPGQSELVCGSRKPIIVNPILAFVKAFKMKGDATSLASVLANSYSANHIDEALKALWATCHVDLKRLGFNYHSRRSTDPAMLFHTTLGDLVTAIDKLDLDDCLPSLHCEAADLLSLPPLETDSVAKQVELNTVAVRDLTETVSSLQTPQPTLLTNETLVSSIDSLKELVKTATCLKDELAATIRTASKSISKPTLRQNVAGTADLEKKPRPANPVNRRLNIILFGLPENDDLKVEKSMYDDTLQFVAGKTVPWNDAFRLGRKKVPENLIDPPRPRPVLIKLCNEWDRRILLASRRKLKDYRIKKVFLREDLPLEARKERAHRYNGSSMSSKHPPPQNIEDSIRSKTLDTGGSQSQS